MTIQTHVLIPSTNDVPAYTITRDDLRGTAYNLQLDSAATWRVDAPDARWLRDLAQVALELAERVELIETCS